MDEYGELRAKILSQLDNQPFDPKTRELVADLKVHNEVLTLNVTHESDRGVALIYAAHADESLERLIRGYFVATSRRKATTDALFEGFGPLTTLSGKTRIAYSFSLIGAKVFNQLDLVRKTRNAFAHSVNRNAFSHPDIRKLLEPALANVGGDSMKGIADYEREHRGYGHRLAFESLSVRLGAILHSAIIVVNSELPLEAKLRILDEFGSW